MSRRPRETERVDFGAGELERIVPYMVRLADAGDGWINLTPKFGEEDEEPAPLKFFTLFGGGGSGVTMCTWIPGGRRDDGVHNPASLGITHVTGRRAVAQLQSLAIAVPGGWFVEQDHPRRGLVLRVPFEAPLEQVIGWGLRATSALTPPRDLGTRSWRGDVYLPTAS